MGVADNKTYRDMYHFSNNPYGVASKDHPSIENDPKINTTIKENPYRANVEIEKDEIILTPEMDALFKAVGKTHKQGGIDVQLKPNSFVFSADRSLAFTERDKKMMELKEGGRLSQSTPADVLKKNIDMEHYNKLMTMLQDPKTDTLAKKSAERMASKYIATLGNIAYMQESKKNFPDGLPSFSQAAPVFNPEVEDELDEQKQYAKYGGVIDSMQKGGYPDWLKAWTKANTVKGKTSPTGFIPTTYPKDKNLQNDYDYWKQIAGRDFKSPEDFQGFVYSSIEQQDPKAIEEMWTKYGHTAKNKDQDIQNFVDNIFGVRSAEASGYRFNTTPKPGPIGPLNRQPGTQNLPTPEQPKDNIPTPGEVTGAKDMGKQFPWQFSDWQKLSMANDLYKLASVKRYMPYRSQVDLANANPYLVNPEQAVGDIKGAANSQISALNTLNPILRNAQAAGIAGQVMNQLPQLRSQYDNQNAQIKNQFAQYNNQINNQEKLTNVGMDQQYYQQSITGQANHDNMKNYLRDQYMNNLMTNVQDNQSLAYNLATMDNPAYGYDFKSGNFYRNPKDIRDVNTDSKSDMYTQIAQKLYAKMQNGETPTKEEIDFFKALSLGKVPFKQSKKGGTVKNPYK